MEVKYESRTLGWSERIPSMRVAVTGACNLKCSYCPTNGDNYILQGNNLLSSKEFVRVTLAAYRAGINHFSITGGEPLVVPDITFGLARKVKGLSGLGYLRLNTNGFNLVENVSEIKRGGFQMVKVSLDSLMTGKYGASLGQTNVADVLNGIDGLIGQGIATRINMVV